jgi:hypothetical protein
MMMTNNERRKCKIYENKKKYREMEIRVIGYG